MSLRAWWRTPWRVLRLKRRVTAQRGTIIAQRGEILRLRSTLAELERANRNADILAVRRERNKQAATGVVASKLRALQNENDVLADRVRELQQ